MAETISLRELRNVTSASLPQAILDYEARNLTSGEYNAVIDSACLELHDASVHHCGSNARLFCMTRGLSSQGG